MNYNRVLSSLLLTLFLGCSSSSHSADASAPIDDQLAAAYKNNAGVGVVAGLAVGIASAHWLFSPCKKDSMWERLPGYHWYQTKKRNSSHTKAWQIAENVAKGIVVVAITTGTAWMVYRTLNAPIQALNPLKEENRVIDERLAKKDHKIQELEQLREEELAAKEEENKVSEKGFVEKEEEIQQLKEVVDKYHSFLVDSSKQKEQIQAFHLEITKLQEENRDLTWERGQKEEKIQDLNQRLNAVKEENDSLKEEKSQQSNKIKEIILGSSSKKTYSYSNMGLN